MQLKLENIEMNNVNTDVTETSETAFINDVRNITVTNPYVSWNSDNNNGNGETKNNKATTVTVDIPSSNTFDEETCSVSHNICNICTLHVPYTMFCH